MRYSQEAIRKLVEEQQASGKSVRDFCTARGLNREVFYVWRQRSRKGGAGFGLSNLLSVNCKSIVISHS
jgi:hypothetical protein